MLSHRISRTFRLLVANGLDKAAGVRSCEAIRTFCRPDHERAVGSGEGKDAGNTVEGAFTPP